MSASVAAEVKDRLDIVDYIGRSVSDLKKVGNLYKACCPFHSEKTPSFVVNPASQTWRCFGQCAEGGDIFNFAMKKQGWTFTEALQELGRLAGVETQRERTPQQREQDSQRERLYSLLKTAADFYHDHLLSDDPASARVREYSMLQRGFTLDTLRQFQIGYAPDGWTHMLDALVGVGYTLDEAKAAGVVSTNDKGRTYDRFRQRLMIPIRDDRGRVTGFGARALNPDDTPKYLNSPQSVMFDKSRTLFGLDVAKASIRDSGVAVIVEGYMDVIQAHQAGFTNVVAQMGTALTDAQITLLVPRYTQKLVLALDADEAGQNAMRRSLEVARQTLATHSGQMSAEIRIMQMSDAKDPDDVLRETPHLWSQYVEQAIPVADFVIQREVSELPVNASPQDKQRVAQSLLPILAASENNVLNRDNMQKLALALRIEEKDIFSWAEEFQRQARAKAAASVPPVGVSAPEAVARPDQPPLPPIPNLLPLDEFPTSEEAPLYFGEETCVSSEEAPASTAGNAAAQPASAPLPPVPQTPLLQSRHQSRQAEIECLRQLALNFDFFYEVNRRFRELCAAQAGFANHAWSEFSPQDFAETDLRLLATLLIEAHQQDDETPYAYLDRHLDASLQGVWLALLREDADQIHDSVNGRMRPELDDILKKQERTPMTLRERRTLQLRRVLEVRDKRLRREQVEVNFLLRETPPSDHEKMHHLLQIAQETLRVLHIFQRGLTDTI